MESAERVVTSHQTALKMDYWKAHPERKQTEDGFYVMNTANLMYLILYLLTTVRTDSKFIEASNLLDQKVRTARDGGEPNKAAYVAARDAAKSLSEMLEGEKEKKWVDSLVWEIGKDYVWAQMAAKLAKTGHASLMSCEDLPP
jgi:hypothetical protein